MSRRFAPVKPRMRYLLPAALLPLAAACPEPEGQWTERRVGIIHHFGESENVLAAPDTVTAGESFTVTIRTYGDGCYSEAGAEVEADGPIAIIVPHDDVITGPEVVCPQVLLRPERTVTLAFDDRGVATVRVRGRRVDADVDEPFEVEREIRVR